MVNALPWRHILSLAPVKQMKTIYSLCMRLCANTEDTMRHHISGNLTGTSKRRLPHQRVWSQRFLCTSSQMKAAQCVEAESGPAGWDTPQKISRGLHPTLPPKAESCGIIIKKKTSHSAVISALDTT